MDEKEKTTLNMEKFKKKIQEAVATISPQGARRMLDELSEALTPYIVILENEDLIKEELEKRGFTEDMYALADSDDPEKRKLFLDAFHAVVEAIGKDSSIEESEQIINVITKKANSIEYPLDKLNSLMWSKEGNLSVEVNVAKEEDREKDISIAYAIDFTKLIQNGSVMISNALTAYDKRVYIAVAALFKVKNEILSIPMIYHAMGFAGDPGESDRAQIYKSIIKMRFTAIHIDTTKEARIYKYPKFEYNGALLPSDDERNVLINGNFTERAIRFFIEPPLIKFARERKQITTFDIKLLQSPISKTDINLKIEDYLLERIARAKEGTGQPKILYKTIADKVGIENMTKDNQKNLRKRLPDKINRYLNYYVKCQFIKKYVIDKDGVTVFFFKKKD